MTSSRSSLRQVVATGGMIFAVLMNVLDSTIANVALPHMQGSLSASQDQMTWVLTSYILGAAVMTPLSGWLSLKIGLKPTFLIAIAAFVFISMLCGVATSLPELVVLRLLQGIAGAAVVPLSQAAIFGMWPPHLLPRVISIWAAVAMTAPIMGPTLGGFLTEHLSWRWVFYINLPIGLVAFVMVFVGLERNPGGQQRPFDFLGFAALVLLTCGVQLMLDRGPGRDWFSSPEIWTWAMLAVCGLHIFVVQTLTAKHPFFDTALFRDRNFVTGAGFQMAVAAVMMAVTALLPTMMQQLLGYSALQSGNASMSRGFGSLIGYVFAPWLTPRLGHRPVILAGIALMAASLYAMSRFDLSMTSGPIETTGFFMGVGQSLIFNPVAVLAYVTLDPGLRTEGTVFSTMFRTVAGSVGIALMQAGLTRQSAVAHEALAAHVAPADPLVRWAAPSAFDGAAGALPAMSAEVTRQASMIAYDSMFAWMTLGSLALLPLVLFLKSTKPAAPPLREVHVD